MALCAALPLAPLEDISLTSFSLPPSLWVAIADACAKTRSLKKLTLRQCGFADGGRPGSGAHLARALGGCGVKLLDVSGFHLGDTFAVALCQTPLLANNSLAVLRLSGCGISCEGATALATAISQHGLESAMKLLDLTYNRIGDSGASALANMLVDERSAVPLQVLELEGNSVGDAGGRALWRAARGGLVLARLNLSLNKVGEQTVLAAAEALRSNTGTLKEVAMTGCRCDDAATFALVKSAAANRALTLLDVRGMTFGSSAMDALATLLATSSSLHTLCMDVANGAQAERIARELLPKSSSLLHLTLGGPVPDAVLSSMSATLAANNKRRAERDAFAGGGGSAATAKARVPADGSKMPLLQVDHSPDALAGGSRAKPRRPSVAGAPTRSARTSGAGHPLRTSLGGGGGGGSPSKSGTLASGGAADRAVHLFRKYDANCNGSLEKQELVGVLREMGLIAADLSYKAVGKLIESEFKRADHDGDGVVSLTDFLRYYEQLAYLQGAAQRESRLHATAVRVRALVPPAAVRDEALQRLYRRYARLPLCTGMKYCDGELLMNGPQFLRLVSDAGLLEPGTGVTALAVNNVVAHCKKGASRLSYPSFLEALGNVAVEANMTWESIHAAVTVQLEVDASVDVSASHASLAGGRFGGGAPAAEKQQHAEAGGDLDSTPTDLTAAMQKAAAAGAVDGSAAGADTPAVLVARINNPVYDCSPTASHVGPAPASKGAASSAAPAAPAAGAAAAELVRLASRISDVEAAAAADRTKLAALGLQVDSLTAAVESVAKEVGAVKATSGGSNAAVDSLAADVATLRQGLASASSQLRELDGRAGGGADAVAALERKVLDRQGRFESALMQVAKQVDTLDATLREEQSTSLKALEAILANSQIINRDTVVLPASKLAGRDQGPGTRATAHT